MLQFKFINPEDIPPAEELDKTKEYLTEVVSSAHDNSHFVVTLKYLGIEKPRHSHLCLFPVIKDDEAFYSDEG